MWYFRTSYYNLIEEKQIEKEEKENEIINEHKSSFQSLRHSNNNSENQSIPHYIILNNHKYVYYFSKYINYR